MCLVILRMKKIALWQSDYLKLILNGYFRRRDMISINDVKEDYVFNCCNDKFERTYPVQLKWNDMSLAERNCYERAIPHKMDLSMTHFLDVIFEEIEQLYCMDELKWFLWEEADEDFINRFSKLMSEICEFPSAKEYEPDEQINPEELYTGGIYGNSL